MTEGADPAPFAAALKLRAGALAAGALRQESASPAALRGLVELCRQAGALEEAAQVNDRLLELAPDDVRAQAIAAILQGRRPPARPSGEATWPTPFVRLTGFLPSALHEQIAAMMVEALPRFRPSAIYDAGHRVNPTYRSSLVLYETRPFAELFLPYVKAAVAEREAGTAFGIDQAALRFYELEATCHGSGAFFKAHIDNGPGVAEGRLVSFVYYFHTAPKQFSGGDLLLFDSAGEPGLFTREGFTRVEPLDNSLIIFPSAALHEVERVEAGTDDPAAGRFSLNGWIRAARPG